MPDWMDGTSIAFPNLGLFFEYIPKTFRIFGIEIAMYGLLIGIGVILAFSLISHTAKKDGMDPEDFFDMGLWVLVIGILGARIYYVIFMWDYYKNDLGSILNIRQGGLAIYGGVLAGFATAVIWCRVRKKNLFALTDIAFLGVLVGQSVGRWGNFTNREVFGGYTDSLFAMRLPIEAVRAMDISPDLRAHIVEGTNYIQVHPTFLYESVCNLILLILMYNFRGKKKFDGEMTCWYLGGYGIIRFIIEGIRTDQLKFAGTNIAVSQCLGMLLFVIAVTVEVIVRVRQNKYRKNTIRKED